MAFGSRVLILNAYLEPCDCCGVFNYGKNTQLKEQLDILLAVFFFIMVATLVAELTLTYVFINLLGIIIRLSNNVLSNETKKNILKLLLLAGHFNCHNSLSIRLTF